MADPIFEPSAMPWPKSPNHGGPFPVLFPSVSLHQLALPISLLPWLLGTSFSRSFLPLHRVGTPGFHPWRFTFLMIESLPREALSPLNSRSTGKHLAHPLIAHGHSKWVAELGLEPGVLISRSAHYSELPLPTLSFCGFFAEQQEAAQPWRREKL